VVAEDETVEKIKSGLVTTGLTAWRLENRRRSRVKYRARIEAQGGLWEHGTSTTSRGFMS